MLPPHSLGETTEVIVVSPIGLKRPVHSSTFSAPYSSPHGRRKITPLPESSASEKSVVISPRGLVSDKSTIQISNSPVFASSKRLFPTGEVAIDKRCSLKTTHSHPDPSESLVKIPTSRHVILPFNLRQNPEAFHKDVNSKLLYRIFPNTDVVSFDGYFLVFCLKILPPEPRPLTVAGVPSYFTTDRNDDGPSPPIKRGSKSHIRISPEIDSRNVEERLDDVFTLVKDFFVKARISITEIQYWNNFLVIVLEHRNTDLNMVPRAVACCPCYYIFEDEMGRPRDFPVRRIKEPIGDIVDNGQYDILRPGVMVSSGKHPTEDKELLTSSGVLVKDTCGNKYMTVASHGFPFGTKVFHPLAGHREIGEVIMEITHTDVAIVKLHEGVEFVNVVFENTLVGGPPIQLRQLARAKETQIGSEIYMDNPFTGYIEGTCGSHSILRIPSDDPYEPEQRWIKTRWDYLGQGSNQRMMDDMCGSAIWNNQDMVVGFFRYAPTSGHFVDWCLTVSTDHVIDHGFSLVES